MVAIAIFRDMFERGVASSEYHDRRRFLSLSKRWTGRFVAYMVNIDPICYCRETPLRGEWRLLRSYHIDLTVGG